MKSITLKIPEEIMAKIELLLQIQNRNLDELLINLLENYIENSLQSLSQRKETHTMNTTKRNDITMPMIETAYEIAKKVYFGNTTRTEGKVKINQLSGMGEGSAQDYITDFLAMMSGDTYTRTMSAQGTEYFLRNIYNDFGVDKFKMAVSATKKHLAYYETVSPTKSPKRANLLKTLENELL